jgi:hypothetical protein
MLAQDAIDQAQKLIEAQRAREAAKRLQIQARRVERTVIDRDPFARLGVKDPESDPRLKRYRAPATDAQKEALKKAGLTFRDDLSKRQASELFDGLKKRRDSNLCTIKQENVLRKHGVVDADRLTFNEASRLMGVLGPKLAAKQWGFKFTPELVTSVLGQRDAGWDG